MNYFAFLRNVMVGRKGLTQTVLLKAFQECGAAKAASFLATGNVAFDCCEDSLTAFAECVAATLRSETGLQEPIYFRSLADLQGMQAQTPFLHAPTDDIYERCVTFLPAEPIQLPPLPLRSARRDVEIFAATAGEAYSITRMIGGKSGYAGALIEKVADVKVTTRNWNTIERLLRKYA